MPSNHSSLVHTDVLSVQCSVSTSFEKERILSVKQTLHQAIVKISSPFQSPKRLSINSNFMSPSWMG